MAEHSDDSISDEVMLTDLAKRVTVIEAIVRPLQPMADHFDALEKSLSDQTQQLSVLNLALTRLELDPKGKSVVDPFSAEDSRTGKSNSSDHDDDDRGPVYHKLEFPKFDGKSDPLA